MSRRALICFDPRPAVGVGLLLLACAPLSARTGRPEGIAAGPWLLSPWLKSSYDLESNVFLDEDDADGEDQISRLEGGLLAELPFRNSTFEFEYQTSKLHYSETEFKRDFTQSGEVALELRFSSGDRLTLRDIYRRDFARARNPVSEGAESFVGEPYNVNRWEVELQRDRPERPGYLVRVRRVDFIYEGVAQLGFFDYRGFDYRFEYRHPLPARKKWVVNYSPRRFDHFKPQGIQDPAFPVGVPFRTETTNNLTVGFSGLLGEEQPYRIELGYGRSVYDDREDGESTEFVGVVGSASWDIRIGGRSGVDLTLSRRSLPSIVSSYYINNGLRADFHRDWLNFQGGLELDWTTNSYGVAEACGTSGGEFKRKDNTIGGELYWDWKVHDLFRFEFSSYYEKRNSNCDLEDYDASGISAGVRLGWF